MSELNIENVHDSWRPFFEKNKKLLNSISRQIGQDFTPSNNNVFIIFQKPKESINFVIIGQDPYPQNGHATGRSFERELSSWNGVNESLQAILCSIYYNVKLEYLEFRDILNKIEQSEFSLLPPNSLFKNWETKNGVFLLNSSLTTKIGVKNAHKNIWEPFTRILIKELSVNSEITWFLWGSEAKSLEGQIRSGNVIKSDHPALFSYKTDSIASKEALTKFCNQSGLEKILNFKRTIAKTANLETLENLEKELVGLKSKQDIQSEQNSDSDYKRLQSIISLDEVYFLTLVSNKFPLSKLQLDKYDSILNWGHKGLSTNSILDWNEKLIDKYYDRWDWENGLSKNTSIPFSDSLLQKYSSLWSWIFLSRHEISLNWTEEIIFKYSDKWEFSSLSEKQNIPWSDHLLHKYKDKWRWYSLSENENLPWNEELINKYQDKWNAGRLSVNKAIPWSISFIERNSKKLSWAFLSENKVLPTPEILIEKHIDKWDWNRLSSNKHLPWSINFINKYANHWNWSNLSSNKAVPWSADLIHRFQDKWDFSWLTFNEEFPLTIDLLDIYKDKWNWSNVSKNQKLNWTEHVLEKYDGKLDWKWLSYNTKLPWSETLLDKHLEKWDWYYLSFNKALPWSQNLIEKYSQHWDWTMLRNMEGVKIPFVLLEKFRSNDDKSRSHFKNWSYTIHKEFKEMSNDQVEWLLESILRKRNNSNKSSFTLKESLVRENKSVNESRIQYKPCPECGSMHNAAYTRCAVCNDFSATNDPL